MKLIPYSQKPIYDGIFPQGNPEKDDPISIQARNDIGAFMKEANDTIRPELSASLRIYLEGIMPGSDLEGDFSFLTLQQALLPQLKKVAEILDVSLSRIEGISVESFRGIIDHHSNLISQDLLEKAKTEEEL